MDLGELKAELRTRGNQPDDVMGDADCFQAALSAIESLQAKVAELEKDRDDLLSGARQTMIITAQHIERIEAKVAELEKDKALLLGLIRTVMAIPSMTDEQLAELKRNAEAAL